MKKSIFISPILVLYLIVYTNVSAQNNTTIWTSVKEDARHSYQVGLGLIKSPFTASALDWLNIGYAGAGTAALFIVDPGVQEIALSNQNSFGDRIFEVDNIFNKEYVIIYTPAIYLTGLVIRNQKIRRTGLYAMESVLIASSITAGLKRVFGRSRPNTGDDHMTFRLFGGDRSGHRALPSGHATGAFAFSTVMAKSIDNTWWKTFWYGTGVVVASARIYNNKHWISDTLLGGFIGYATANFVVNFEKNKDESTTNASVNVKPYFNTNQLGMIIYF